MKATTLRAMQSQSQLQVFGLRVAMHFAGFAWFLIVGSFVSPMVRAADYYVGSAGDDSHSGRSTATAWRTIARACRETFGPGDRLSLEGGQTFRGHLTFGPDDRGNSIAPITVGSYGEGQATIDGGDGSGITIAGCVGLNIVDLTIVGSGRKGGNQQGVGIYLRQGQHLRMDRVEVSGFQRAGVEIDGCSEVRIARVFAHDNGYAGISSDGDRSENIYIEHCRAINNPGDPTNLKGHSGSGIVLFNVSKATIEYCEAAENGWDMPRTGNGPVGIWAAVSSDRVVIQFCIAHHNKSPGADGGGFDFDGGVTNSVMQYNYSYKNKGWGYLFWEYGSDSPFRNNVLRYCISEDDGAGGIGVGERAIHGFSDCEIYNNVVSNETGNPCVEFIMGAPKGFHFRNNVFRSRGGPQIRQSNNARFEGNCYWTIGGGFAVDGYPSLDAWAAATGQETLDGVLVGLNVDPGWEPSGIGRVSDPDQLHMLTAYRLLAGSPLIDRGLNLRKQFGIDPGLRRLLWQPCPNGRRLRHRGPRTALIRTTPGKRHQAVS